MTDEELSTRDKILLVAGTLFAKNGLNGTSVREIASAANVNLAAINYHFENKEKLYWATFSKAYVDLDNEINGLDSSLNTEELAWKIYEFFCKNSDNMRHTFAMMISDMSTEDTVKAADLPHLKSGAPPGFSRLSDSIQKEFGKDLPVYGVFWATMSIFNQLVHTTLVTNSTFFKEVMCTSSAFPLGLLDSGVRFQIRAVLKYLQTNSAELDNPDFAKALADRNGPTDV